MVEASNRQSVTQMAHQWTSTQLEQLKLSSDFRWGYRGVGGFGFWGSRGLGGEDRPGVGAARRDSSRPDCKEEEEEEEE